VSLVPDPQVLSLRMFVREYFALADNLTDCKLRFANELRLLFPGFKDAFANPFSAAALTVLKAILPCKRYRQRIWILWPAPLPMLPKEVRIGPWKTEKLFDYSLLADSVGLSSPFLEEKIRLQIQTIQGMEATMAKFEATMRKLIASEAFPEAARKT